MKDTRKLVVLALLTALALIIFVLESMIPPLVPIPGIKLGLANIITLFVLARYGAKEAVVVTVVRIILASVFAGQAISFIYSIAGGALCLILMILLHKLSGGKLLWFTSVIGAVAHNTGQLIAASVIMGTKYVFAYAPFLLVSGVVTGLFTGLCAYLMLKYIPEKLL